MSEAEKIVRRSRRKLKVLTWHVHGNYLYYLVQTPHEFYLPVKPGRPEGYGGRSGSFPWPDSVHDIPAERVREQEFDVILFQSRKNYLEDRFEILSDRQQKLPRIFLEHDPPQESPTDTRHPVDDPEMLLVHVTGFNDLMWDGGRTPTRVIHHGVMVPEGVSYSGELDKGIVVINNLKKRGRRLGKDVFERARERVALDLVGMNSAEMGGLGEFSHAELAAFEAHYRFFFNPIRYTSLGLSVVEAMMIGLPVVGLATTEMVAAIENGVSGYVSTDVSRVIDCMQALLTDPGEAKRLGEGARRTAKERYNIQRFAADWDEAFTLVAG